MNLSKLFQMQKALDERIEKEHPRQEGEDRLAKKILALQVELGELANCWRGFKYWSNDQEPITLIREHCPDCMNRGFSRYNPPDDDEYWCGTCAGYLVIDKNPLLEEYVDNLHFILSIGLDLEIPEIYGVEFENIYYGDEPDITNQFLKVKELALLSIPYTHAGEWNELFIEFVCLGQMLGFTWEQIEEAYMKKNAENHKRQESGY
jgi:dimeric dUTPase (all-alpha-NTP-PPase superfamily)